MTVIVNKLSAAHSGSGGVSVAFPDVCLTKIGKYWVPIPYPNTARSGDLAKGSASVKIDGRPCFLKSSCIKKSTGDEPGRKGGIISRKTKGKAYPRSYSPDVKVEGQPVVRNTDLMLQNGGSPTNTGPAPWMQANAPGAQCKAPEHWEVTALAWSKSSVWCGDVVTARAEARNAPDAPFVFTAYRMSENWLQQSLMAQLRADRAEVHADVTRGPPAPKVELQLRHRNADGNEVRSAPLEVKLIPDVAKVTVGPARRTAPKYVRDRGTGQYAPDGTHFGWQYYFELTIADGEVRIWRPVEFAPRGGLAPQAHPFVPTAFHNRLWKTEIEGVWDGVFLFHRVPCTRRPDCMCVPERRCCKLRLRIQVDFQAGGVPGLEQVKLFPGACDRQGWGQVDKWWYSNTWWEKTDHVPSGVRAHEFGHLIGMYDEYPAGACEPSRQYANRPHTIMAAGAIVEEQHVRDFKDRTRALLPSDFGELEAIR
jgi:hypothetical protein